MRTISHIFLGAALALSVFGSVAIGVRQPTEKQHLEVPFSPFPPFVVTRGNLKVTVGERRIVMRGPMFPLLTAFADGSVILSAQAVKEGGAVTSIISKDKGCTWKPHKSYLDSLGNAWGGVGPSRIQLQNGKFFGLSLETAPIDGKPGWYSMKRWEVQDINKSAQEPLTDGGLYLPPETFDPKKVQWFHGNMIEMPNGDLLAAMQGRTESFGKYRNPFRVYLSKSTDQGKTWKFLSMVAEPGNIDDPDGKTKQGWKLHGPCEPSILHLGQGKLICVARLVDDQPSILKDTAPSDTYHDLSYSDSGARLHPSGLVAKNKFYTLSKPTTPLIISYSSDSGTTWNKPTPMKQPRGCFPRIASSEGIAALSYGGLAYPRWGNCITFSTDGGQTWAEEINFAPFFTTGYTDIVTIGPGKFLVVFDCTPPQPWNNHAAHWVGAVDITVEKTK